jgi:hypothetical protein
MTTLATILPPKPTIRPRREITDDDMEKYRKSEREEEEEEDD